MVSEDPVFYTCIKETDSVLTRGLVDLTDVKILILNQVSEKGGRKRCHSVPISCPTTLTYILHS